jgi:hypothetical protein
MKKSWKDITIADFKVIYDLQRENPEDRLLRLVALVNEVSYEDVLEMPISKLEAHFKDIDFLGQEPKIPLMKGSYELGGTKYKVHTGELTTAMYIDFKQMAETYFDNLPQFLSIFLIPAGHKYGDGYDLVKTYQDISTMSIVDARAVASFFLTACGLSTAIFLRSSTHRINRMIKRARTQQEKETLMALREEILKLRQLNRQRLLP